MWQKVNHSHSGSSCIASMTRSQEGKALCSTDVRGGNMWPESSSTDADICRNVGAGSLQTILLITAPLPPGSNNQVLTMEDTGNSKEEGQEGDAPCTTSSCRHSLSRRGRSRLQPLASSAFPALAMLYPLRGTATRFEQRL